MNKGIIAYVAVLLALFILWWLVGGLSTPFQRTTTTTAPANTIYKGLNNCIGVYLSTVAENAVVSEECKWGGGSIGLWVASGNATRAAVKITGQNGKRYVDQSFNNSCLGMYDVYQLPAQNYSIVLTRGGRGSSSIGYACSAAITELGSPQQNSSNVNTNLVNGKFSTGTYYGWLTTGSAWGLAPLSIADANKRGCYPLGSAWSGYSGNYFASTYQCGLGSMPYGNLTSMPFIASKNFLNFQLLGSGGARGYIEILSNDQVYIKARFSTMNLTNNRAKAFTFTNATLPLFAVSGKKVAIRIIANETDPSQFIALGDFYLGDTPVETVPGVLVNLTLSR